MPSDTTLLLVGMYSALMPTLDSMRRAQNRRPNARPAKEDLHAWLHHLMALVLSHQFKRTGCGSSAGNSSSYATRAATKLMMTHTNSKALMLMSFPHLLFARKISLFFWISSGHSRCHQKRRSVEKPPPSYKHTSASTPADGTRSMMCSIGVSQRIDISLKEAVRN